MMLVLSSPSGAGKTTLARRLILQNPDLVLSVSDTTRPHRPSETDGVDYNFIETSVFKTRRDRGGYYESAEVFGHFYGTPREPAEAAVAEGRDMVFDIDWQGARLLAEAAPEDVVRVFILPPSMALLEDRLRKRGEDSPDVIKDRMDRAKAEISHWNEYDYVIVNDDFARALETLELILKAERQRRIRHPWLDDFVNGLMGQ